MRLYVIAGEASGDLHASLLIRELKKTGPLEIRAWGGDKMEAEGAVIVKHYRELAFMGFAEVIANLGTILRNLTFCKKDVEAYAPDALLLVDYPGFNLRMAKWAKSKGIPVIYYISPQVWAWKESRVRQMKRNIDRMIVILPFEKSYFSGKWNWEVDYVGHPLVEVIDRWKEAHGEPKFPGPGKIVAVLPGSRKQEILKKLPVMLAVCPRFPEQRFIVARAPGIEEAFYEEMLKPYPNVMAVAGETYQVLSEASAALVTSGTATLETALFGVPEVVCYKTSPLSYQIGKRLIRVKYISLVNLIMDRLIVRELIHDDMNPENLEYELKDLLFNEERKKQLAEDYRTLRKMLSSEGSAPAKAARIVNEMLRPGA